MIEMIVKRALRCRMCGSDWKGGRCAYCGHDRFVDVTGYYPPAAGELAGEVERAWVRPVRGIRRAPPADHGRRESS